MEEFEKMIDELDELEDLRLYDEAKDDNDEGIPFDEAVKMIRENENTKKPMPYKIIIKKRAQKVS